MGNEWSGGDECGTVRRESGLRDGGASKKVALQNPKNSCSKNFEPCM